MDALPPQPHERQLGLDDLMPDLFAADAVQRCGGCLLTFRSRDLTTVAADHGVVSLCRSCRRLRQRENNAGR